MKKSVKSSLILLASFALLSSCSTTLGSSSQNRASESSLSEQSSSLTSFSSSLAQFTIQFLAEDGTVLQSGAYAEGTLPSYEGNTPSKAMTATTFYTFKGWTPAIVAVTGNATYTATFASHDIAEESRENINFVYDDASSNYSIDAKENGCDLPAVIVPSVYDDGTHGSHPVSVLLSEAFSDWNAMKWISLPTSLTKIGDFVFAGCDSLTELAIPEGVTAMEQYALAKCANLSKVTFPSTLAHVGIALFYKDYSIAKIEVASGNPTFTTDGRALIKSGAILEAYANASGTNYSIPEGISAVEILAFAGCDKLETLSFPATLASLGFFEDCPSLKKFVVAEGNPLFSTDSRAVFDFGKKAIYAYANASGNTYAIPDGVEELTYDAFEGAFSLVSITLPNSLKAIDSKAFEDCTALKSVAIPEKVTEIADAAFSGCTSLESVSFPSGLTCINAGSFLFCTKLNNVVLPSTLETIKVNAFYAAQSLTSLSYSGTMSAWAKITKGNGWHGGTPLVSVVCSDGSSTALD